LVVEVCVGSMNESTRLCWSREYGGKLLPNFLRGVYTLVVDAGVLSPGGSLPLHNGNSTGWKIVAVTKDKILPVVVLPLVVQGKNLLQLSSGVVILLCQHYRSCRWGALESG
jgi:hypothetical protein